DAFRACVTDAVAAAEQGYVVTIGIEPTHPATGFGYIELGDRLGDGPAHAVTQFVEKPDRARAEDYLATGRFRWNAGMFVVRVTDAGGVIVPGGDRLVAVVGLDDVVVVDTPDALLVMSRERAQDVKAVVDGLRAEGRTDLL